MACNLALLYNLRPGSISKMSHMEMSTCLNSWNSSHLERGAWWVRSQSYSSVWALPDVAYSEFINWKSWNQYSNHDSYHDPWCHGAWYHDSMLFLFFGHIAACRILVPQPGNEPVSSAVEAES